MCGIAGLVRFDGLLPGEQEIGRAMADLLRHRGPDEAGGYHDARASLGHARLSIIDPAGGRQPLGNEDGTVQVVFNGEIYNHRELAARLADRGHVFRTRSDTEVLVHLYEEEGERFVDALTGMFAIGLWDARRRRLVLVRDQLGIKPLYWHYDGRRLVFASELKSLLAVPGVPAEVDPRALCDYLTFGHVPAPATIYRGICRLEPGFMAVATAAGVVLRRYWDIPVREAEEGDGPNPCPDRRWIERFETLFDEVVESQLISDVPLGAFLSGGVDSAAVVSSMVRVCPRGVLTHTVGFEASRHDERLAARITAERLGTDHRDILVRPDAAATVDRLARHFDEPFADSSALPMLHLAEAARSRVKVALSGDGGDELLAGYRRYRFDLIEAGIRRCLPRGMGHLCGWVGRLYPRGAWLPQRLRAGHILQNLACDPATAHLRSVSLLGGRLPAVLLRPELLEALEDYSPFTRARDLYARCRRASPLDRLLYLDLKTLLPDDMLTKVDRMSMAVGLEVRVPLLDHRLVSLAMHLPERLKLRDGRGKVVLRELVGRRLGSEIGERAKHGFEVPVDAWFRGPLAGMVQAYCSDRGAGMFEWLRPEAVQRLIHGHLSGRHHHGHVLWMLLMLERWVQVCCRQRPVLPSVSECADRQTISKTHAAQETAACVS